MNHPSRSEDNFDVSRSLLGVLAGIVVLAAAVMLIDGMLRPVPTPSRPALGPHVCLVPSGRPLRYAQMQSAAVDLRFSPLLPLNPPDPALLLLPKAGPITPPGLQE